MLVKVRNDDPSRLSSTERTVVNWLKSWSGPHAVPGIAVVQCQDADVVVWTPQTCVVVAVHGFTERVNGTLACAQDEPWTVDGRPAPIDGDVNPLERVRQQTVELAQQLRSAPGRERVPVSGLVLLVPQLGSRVKLEKGALPPGIDVLIGDGPSSLRSYFTSLAEGAEPAWDAAQVGQALGALGFAAAASYSDLISEGFPPPESGRDSPPPLSAAPTVVVPSVPVPSDASSAPAGATASTGVGGTETGGAGSPGTPGRDTPAAQQVPSGGRPSRLGMAAAGASAAAAAAAAYRAVTGGSEPPQQPAQPPASRTQQPGPGQYGPGQGSPAQSGQGQGGPGQSGQGQGGPGQSGQGQGGPGPGQSGPGQGGQQPAAFAQGQRPPMSPPGPQPMQGGAPRPSGPTPESSPQAAYSAAPTQPAAPGFPVWPDQQPGTQIPKRKRPRRDLSILGGLVLILVLLLVAVMCAGRSGENTNDNQHPATQTTKVRPTPTTSTPMFPLTTPAPACFPLAPCPG
ncbi:NERD domain-containing protein [Nocardia sp. NPDC051030]|uniref:NERD domain-containing protein n=1 Tax=Nocardia sp. NPDC051030 TaxID=3155162 RepID=UPI00343C7FFD